MATGFGSDDDLAPEALQVLDMDMNLPISALPYLDAAATTTHLAAERARKLHATRCTLIAHTFTQPGWQWALDQAVYDAGARLFVAARDALQRKGLAGRLPSDARYWALLPAATLLKRAQRVVGMLRGSGRLVEMVGIVDDLEVLRALGEAAAKSKSATEPLPLLIGSRTGEGCVEIARVVKERYPALRVAGVMFDAGVAATVGARGVAAFVGDVAGACGEDEDGNLPRLDLVVGSEFAGAWREQLAKPGLHKKCRVVLYTPISAKADKGY